MKTLMFRIPMPIALLALLVAVGLQPAAGQAQQSPSLAPALTYPFVAKGSAGAEPRAVDAKIEVVWPHDELGRERPVSEAPLANVLVYLFERGTLDPVPCGFDNRVILRWAEKPAYRSGGGPFLYPAHDEPPYVRHMEGTKATLEAQAKKFPAWVFNDVPIVFVSNPDRDASRSTCYFVVQVEGVDFRTNVWAHGADPRTYQPKPDIYSSMGSPAMLPISVADAYIDSVWPHDDQGREMSVTEGSMANVAATIGSHGDFSKPSVNWPYKVKLYRSLNDNYLEMVKEGERLSVPREGMPPLLQPRWIFNDVDVSAARNPANKYYFAIQVEGVETHTTIWAHGADARTMFPKVDVPSRSGDECS